MPSLDGYSLNEKIDRLNLEVREQLVGLKEEFTELYKYINELKMKETKVEQSKESKKTKPKAKKEVTKKA